MAGTVPVIAARSLRHVVDILAAIAMSPTRSRMRPRRSPRSPRPGRRPRPAPGAPRARDRRRRRPQPAHDRPARLGQDDAGAAAARHPAAARRRPRRSRSRASTRPRACSRPARGSAERPFRAPHHTASAAALVGGGRACGRARSPSPIAACSSSTSCPSSTARALEALREPLEDGEVASSRAPPAASACRRAFMLVAAMNPCPCGLAGDPDRECTCPPSGSHAYRSRVSGPLLDRLDLRVEAPRPTPMPRRARRPRRSESG